MLSGDSLGAHGQGPMTEVVVTLRAPSMSAFGRSLQSASHHIYMRQVDSAQTALATRITSALPDAQVRWRYHLVADGMAVYLPRSQAALLAKIPGVARVWPNVRFHALRDTAAAAASVAGPQQIGADKLWGPNFTTAGNGMKIGIIDDGLQASHPYFNPNGYQYPPGFPKGQTQYTTPKVIVQRTFAPLLPAWKYANDPFDPVNSFHATHVAGIAAGDYGEKALGNTISGVAPNAYLGNYKALTTPLSGGGLDGNAAEIAAAIEAAVSDGMNVINLSIGEPEVDPARDIVVQALDGAAAAGVVPVVAAGNDFTDFGYGSVSSPGNAPDAITVAAASSKDQIAYFSSAGPTPDLAADEARRDGARRERRLVSADLEHDLGVAERNEHGDAARRRSGRAPARAPPRLDGCRGQVGSRPDCGSGPQLERHRGADDARGRRNDRRPSC